LFISTLKQGLRTPKAPESRHRAFSLPHHTGGHGMVPPPAARHLQRTAHTFNALSMGMTQQFFRFSGFLQVFQNKIPWLSLTFPVNHTTFPWPILALN